MARREFQMPSVLRHEGRRPYWYIRYRRKVLTGNKTIKREERWHRLGFCDEMTKREALRKRDEVMYEINHEIYTISSHVRLADFVEKYKEIHVATLASSASPKYLNMLKNHILPAFGHLRLCDIGVEQLQAFINQKTAAGMSYWSRNDLKGILSGIFTKATDWGYWHQLNPLRRVTIGRRRHKYPRLILRDEQIHALLDNVPPKIRLMIETVISTGVRVSELLGLKWGRVDLERGIVFIEERYYRGDTDVPKTERSRRALPLGHLTEVYRQLKPPEASPDDYVFHIDGRPMDGLAISRRHIKPAAQKLGFDFLGFGWHTFRRQNLTLIQEEGATAIEAQAQAGHARPVMTSEYTFVGIERREQAVCRLQQRLGVERKEDDPAGN